ncbi:hypothetical protein SASPL_105704 [Salvia splendens]|uniref:PPM-type phosphatase domain-containing protein n=1 Tax=Salvia splendens TaxID=180675 RepID=A0A8X9AA84_SALSN|nr:hypothetical protein SASPL_105704 [Salvia splendens]
MLVENLELALMGSCVLAMLTMDHSTSVKEEVRRIRYARCLCSCEQEGERLTQGHPRLWSWLSQTGRRRRLDFRVPKWNNALLEMLQKTDKFLILSSDGLYQYFTNKEAVSEVETFMSMYPEGDPAQHLVEEVLIRAAKKSGMDFYDLLEIPQGEWRRYHDDVSIIIISLQGKYGVHQCKC